MKSVEFLQAHSLFGGIGEEDLMNILSVMEPVQYARGAIIVHEGDPGDRLFFILEGSVDVLKKQTNAEDAESFKITTLERGETFGEMGLIDVQSRSATVQARTRVRALSLTNHNLHQLYHRDASLFGMIVLNLARQISRRLRVMNERVEHAQAFTGEAVFH